MRYYTALTIAGSDSCGGAGIQADIKTMSALGVYAASAITAITVQNTKGVYGIQNVEPEIVKGHCRLNEKRLTINDNARRHQSFQAKKNPRDRFDPEGFKW